MSKRGFTLIELLVVMVILSILVVLSTGTYIQSTKRGRDNRRKSDVRNIQTALETYNNDKGSYPTGSGGMIMGCGENGMQVCTWGEEFKNTTTGTLYMTRLPADPLSSRMYYYGSTGVSYNLYAKLENTKDEGDGVNQAGYTGTNCGSGVLCTYGVASSNTTP